MMAGRGSIPHRIVWFLCLLALVHVGHGRPSSEKTPSRKTGLTDEAGKVQKESNLADNTLQWELDWWTPKDTQDTEDDVKDGWKVFATDKAALKKRWWEESWEDDQWWVPTDDNTVLTAKNKLRKTDKDNDTPNTAQDRPVSDGKQQKGGIKKETPHQILHPSPERKIQTAEASAETREKKRGLQGGDTFATAGESPREKVRPVWIGDDLLSPFDDPRPRPFPGPEDEIPDDSHWHYHQPSGLGRYIEHKSEHQTSTDNKNMKIVNKIEKHSSRNSTKQDTQNVVNEHKQHETNVHQDPAPFYGFGLESKLSVSANVLKEKNKPRKLTKSKVNKESRKSINHIHREPTTTELPVQENYNKGVIYDYNPDDTDLIQEKPAPSPKPKNIEDYDKDFISTKADPQTSPNPPPPDLAADKIRSETTPVPPKIVSDKVLPQNVFQRKMSKSVTHKKKLPKKVAPKKSSIKNVMPKSADSGNVSPKKTSPQKMSSKNMTSQKVSQKNLSPLNVSPKNTSPQKMPPKNKSLQNVTSKDLPSQKVSPQKTEPEQTPAKKEGKKKYVKSRPLTFCKLDADCRRGRTCRRGMCMCMAEGECQGRKAVCGSDGVQYQSHCELHRAACVSRLHIRVDTKGACFANQEKEKTTKATQTTESVNQARETTTISQPINTVAAPSDDDDNNDNDGDDDNAFYENEYGDENGFDEDESEEENGDERSVENLTDPGDHGSSHADTTAKTSASENSRNQPDNAKSNKGSEPSTKGRNEVEETSKGGNQQTTQEAEIVKGENPEGSETDYEYQSDGSYGECSQSEMDEYKRQLLFFYCQRFQEPDCQLEVRKERDYLTNLLFSYLDMDTDYHLSFQELQTRQASPTFPQLSKVCQITDLIWNDDVDEMDGRLSLQEFSDAFAELYSPKEEDVDDYYLDPKPASVVPVISLVPTLATVGNGLELKCGLAVPGSAIVWKRHGIDIRDLHLPELLVLDDGSLFFSKMGVHHMGNYSCQDKNDLTVIQVHSLKVQMPPIVQVSPQSQIEASRSAVKMRCHAEGVPRPSMSWHMNNKPLNKDRHRYHLAGSGEQLTLYDTDYREDTGAYTCVAKNQAGTSQDVTSLFIIGDKDSTASMGLANINLGKFAVFHNEGYTVYDPNDCLKHRSVHPDFGYFKFIPDTLDKPLRLCEAQGGCTWGGVANVQNRLLYATQPALNRVVVIETTKNWIPVQVISTDKRPIQVHYVEHLDQVWVLCWNGEEDDSTKTMVVVRDASKFVQHRVVHTQPVANHFDQIQALFIAPTNDLRHTYSYGYVTHSGQQGLTKMDLDNMRYVNTIDLSSYDCVPRSLAFVPIGGHVVVECVSSANHQTLQLVLDYLTDAVVTTSMLSGRPHVSPDSRHVVTVDDLTGKVSVAGVSNEGTLEAAYEVTVSASISDVAFFPAVGHGYLLVLTSADDDDIITINLSTGKVDKMKGTNRLSTSSEWYPSPVKRAIISGDVFSDFLLAPSKSALSIMDMRFQQVRCEYTDTPHTNTAIFIGH